MGMIGNALLGGLGVLLTVFVGVMVRLAADDIKEWTPIIAGWLIDRAVFKLPEDCRDRWSEEWRCAILHETPGCLPKMAAAAGCVVAARRMRRERERAGRHGPLEHSSEYTGLGVVGLRRECSAPCGKVWQVGYRVLAKFYCQKPRTALRCG